MNTNSRSDSDSHRLNENQHEHTAGSEEEELLFEAACAIDDTEKRDAFLDDACAGNPELRKYIDQLIRCDETAQQFLETPAIDVRAKGEIGQLHDDIENLELKERIGSGGFGVVWTAHQTAPVQRLVAVKIIRLGRDTEQILQRFQLERQTLAMMSHPNIATILDAGTTRLGRPYFVMELVDGQPIDEYCDARRYSVSQRLELFINLCHPVQHAHVKGVVHRDLKPSNVLVADVEGRPVPKVIDFGIAKAMPSAVGVLDQQPSFDVESELNEASTFSESTHSLAVGTPNYMSPEQICARSDVDTRADVYALGAILHQLLIGRPPQRTGIASVQLSQTLPRMLACLNDPSQQTAVAETRMTHWRGLESLLRTDLQWIVDKALAYSASDRYQSVSELAKDVEGYLGHFPLTVGPKSALYRIQKFVWRNSLATSLVLVALLAILVGGFVAVFSFAREREANLLAEQQEKRADLEVQRAALEADKATKFAQLLEHIFDAADPSSGRPATQTLRAELKEFSDLLGTQLVDYPLSEARLQRAVGRIFRSLRQFEEAGPHLERAHLLRGQHLPTGNMDLLQSQIDYAEYLFYMGRVDESESLVQPALVRLTNEEITLAEVEALAVLSQIRRNQRKKPEAYQLMYSAWQKATDLKGPNDPLTLKYQAKAARKLLASGRKREALELASDSLEKMLEVRHDNHIDVAEVKRDLGVILRIQRDYETAEKLARESLAVFRELTGKESVFAASSLILLARVLKDSGRRDEALEVGREAAAIADATPVGNNSYTRWNTYDFIAETDPGPAGLEAENKSLGIWRELRTDSTELASAHYQFAFKLRTFRRYQAAVEQYEYAIQTKVNLKEPPLRLATVHHAMASLYLESGEVKRARENFRTAIDILTQRPGDLSRNEEVILVILIVDLMECMLENHHFDDAERQSASLLESVQNSQALTQILTNAFEGFQAMGRGEFAAAAPSLLAALDATKAEGEFARVQIRLSELLAANEYAAGNKETARQMLEEVLGTKRTRWFRDIDLRRAKLRLLEWSQEHQNTDRIESLSRELYKY